jgi:lipopolysaccharide/colanic/teichoic acid biosynthesis glycosyltransferase
MIEHHGEQTNIPIREKVYKRPFDLGLLLFGHVLLSPLWLLLWTLIPIAIWLEDRGPVFYRQRRAGKDGRVFIVHKFRTMVPDAELQGPAWTVQGDPRLTRVGRILRRTALDELPELWSVLNGDMSLVGPRPLNENEQNQLEDQIPGFRRRLMFRPGLTGLAQVYDPTDAAVDKLKYDLEYLEHASLWLDGKLILLSVLNSLGARWDRRSGKPQATTRVSSDSGSDQHQDESDVHDTPNFCG